MAKGKKVPEDIQKLLMEVVDHFDKEDTAVRERQIRTARRLKLFWEGFHRVWYSEVAHDWRIWDQETSGESTDQAYYDKPVNVFRAYLESIIAALSITVPPVKCFPDDADNTLDLYTAKAGDKIAGLIYRHNNVSLLWLHALFIYCTEGMVGCYSYPKEDAKYGTYENKKYETTIEKHAIASCPECGNNLEDNVVGADLSNLTPDDMMSGQLPSAKPPVNPEKEKQKEDEFQPYDEGDSKQEYCPMCAKLVTPLMSQEDLIVTRLVGITNDPKTRICMEAYGGLYIKIANYAKKQEDTPYLIYSYETHYANAIEKYEHLHNNPSLKNSKIRNMGGPDNTYDVWGRLSPVYNGEYPLNVVTMRYAWLRPCAFNILADQQDTDKLKKLYPKGVKVGLVNREFGEACPEVLDDCWTLTFNPLADYLVHDPLGLLLVSLQEITNDLISLTVQTIEHGIGQTFADPGVLNFNAYRQLEALPGGIFEATPKSGKSLNDAFHEVKTATLSPEVMSFGANVQNLAQLVSGALPSLFGGAIEGSETASQYSMSRAQALQRLQNTWKMFGIWWKEIFGKAIPAYIQEVEEDERDVQLDTNGNFINVFIRKAELEGKIGKVELEANENLPLTWSQKKDLIMTLLQTQNEEILSILGSPENLPIIREAIGLDGFYVPGEEDVEKQYDEIRQLLASEPMPGGVDPMGQPIETSSVPIDPVFDNNEVEFEIVRKWVISPEGRQTKIDNPNGYMNVMLHGKEHLQAMQMKAMQQAQTQQQGGAPPEKPNETDKTTPIEGEGDVQTV